METILEDLLSTYPEVAVILLGAALLGRRLLRWWSRRRAGQAPWIAVDGSNVLYWQDDIPSLQTVRRVVDALKSRNLRPVVWFDANVGYLFVPGDDTWHGFEKGKQIQRERRSILINYVTFETCWKVPDVRAQREAA